MIQKKETNPLYGRFSDIVKSLMQERPSKLPSLPPMPRKKRGKSEEEEPVFLKGIAPWVKD
ncbi:MAG: hypothetical protein M2R45_04052 [Verrucomicrobia subdivision 3 bacterium]|nr:hypothetical protein [Limisphaerales bacterium]MCS1416964.1 hypothetical protein [Limisphaerales bacterium]